jgi:hypothetical protein
MGPKSIEGEAIVVYSRVQFQHLTRAGRTGENCVRPLTSVSRSKFQPYFSRKETRNSTDWYGQLQFHRSCITPSTAEHLGRVVSTYIALSEGVDLSLGPKSRCTNSDISWLSWFLQANDTQHFKIRHYRPFLQPNQFICHYLPYL